MRVVGVLELAEECGLQRIGEHPFHIQAWQHLGYEPRKGPSHKFPHATFCLNGSKVFEYAPQGWQQEQELSERQMAVDGRAFGWIPDSQAIGHLETRQLAHCDTTDKPYGHSLLTSPPYVQPPKSASLVDEHTPPCHIY
eukprot:g49741.t1